MGWRILKLIHWHDWHSEFWKPEKETESEIGNLLIIAPHPTPRIKILTRPLRVAVSLLYLCKKINLLFSLSSCGVFHHNGNDNLALLNF